ncbi:MAG: dipeptidase [Chloroflexi bacterium]|nr:dipeptidase [Chloroflexota bacterium]
MVSERASKLHFSSLVFDTHSDSLARAVDDGEDLGTETGKGHLDLPRMRAGNQKAQFFAGFVDPGRFTPKDAVKRVTAYFDAHDELCAEYPSEIEQARTAADVRRITGEDKIAGILCVEGGHAMVDSLEVLGMFHERGVRYMTLTHNMSNKWADGIQDEAGDEAPTNWQEGRAAFIRDGWMSGDSRHNGLTDFGREVVREMNRLGVIVDISHVARKTFWDAIETTTKPVMASHSSAWTICQNPRNINDEQLKAVAENNGVVCVNYEVTFVSQACNLATREIDRWRDARLAEVEKEHAGDAEALKQAKDAVKAEHSERSAPELKKPQYTELVDHIDHMVGVAGIDHVGLGSDFDGSRTPTGMEDCSKVPWITEEMLNRGYSDGDVQKVLGLNVLRVLETVVGE